MVLPPWTASPARDDGDRRADDADRIEAVVIEEAAILDGDDGLDQIRRDLGKRHLDAVLFGDGKNFPIGRVKKDVRAGHVAENARSSVRLGMLPSRSTTNQPNPARNSQHDHSGQPASATVEVARR